jgi:hypothetical protein
MSLYLLDIGAQSEIRIGFLIQVLGVSPVSIMLSVLHADLSVRVHVI